MKSFILSGLCCLMTLFPNVKDSDLKDISRPYIGEYECKSAQIGSLDCLEQFSYIRLELKDEEKFILHYQEKGEKKKQVEGKYAYDKQRGVLTLKDKAGSIEREFPLKDGVLVVSFPIARKNVVLKFEQK